MKRSLDERRSALEARYPTWEPTSLDGALDRCTETWGESPLVLTDERSVTYAEVAEWSRRLADGLAALGVEPGDRVGLVLANFVEFVPLKFAIARCGAVAIPFNFLYREHELAYVLAQSRCNVLVTMTGFGGLDQLAMLDTIAPGWESDGPDALPQLRSVVLLPVDGRTREGVLTVEGLEELGRANAGASAGRRPDPASPGDILFTSGTTGSPKGVVVTHDAVLRTAYASALTRAFDDDWRVLFSLPCYHMFGYVEGLLAAMVVGGAIIPLTAFSPEGYLAGIERHGATDILCVPTMTVALLEAFEPGRHDLSSLRALLSGAAPAPVWVWERAREELGVEEIVTGYGMTECGGAMTLTLPEDPLEQHSTTVGRVKLAGVAGLTDRGGALTEYVTLDPSTGERLPEGAEGELASRGPTQMLGYFEKPAETAEALGPDGWLRSGDLGRVRDDGYLQLTGRSKELYKSGGELVMPKEVEELLVQHPGVSQVYVVGVPDERWGEVGWAYVVPEPGATVDPDELLTLCREKLARFKVPRQVRILEAADLPTTPTGKVQKFRLTTRAVEEIAAT